MPVTCPLWTITVAPCSSVRGRAKRHGRMQTKGASSQFHKIPILLLSSPWVTLQLEAAIRFLYLTIKHFVTNNSPAHSPPPLSKCNRLNCCAECLVVEGGGKNSCWRSSNSPPLGHNSSLITNKSPDFRGVINADGRIWAPSDFGTGFYYDNQSVNMTSEYLFE